MTRHFITIASRRFVVGDDDLAEIRQQLLGAVRSGGDFVAMPGSGREIETLVSPGLPIFIEKQEEPELTGAGAATAESLVMPVDEFDDWGI